MRFVHSLTGLTFLGAVSAHFTLDYPYTRGFDDVCSFLTFAHCVTESSSTVQDKEPDVPCGMSLLATSNTTPSSSRLRWILREQNQDALPIEWRLHFVLKLP